MYGVYGLLASLLPLAIPSRTRSYGFATDPAAARPAPATGGLRFGSRPEGPPFCSSFLMLARASLAKSSCFTREGHRKGAFNFSPDLSNSSAETCISKSTHHSIPQVVLSMSWQNQLFQCKIRVHEIVDQNEKVLLGRGTWAASAAASAPKPAASHHADLPSPTAYSEPYLLRQPKTSQRATFTRPNRCEETDAGEVKLQLGFWKREHATYKSVTYKSLSSKGERVFDGGITPA